MSNLWQQQPLILASTSTSRQQLLTALGLQFTVVPSYCDEEKIKQDFNYPTYYKLAAKLAASKALIVSQQFPQSYVIAADQLCVVADKILDKPGSHEVAKAHLRLLSGTRHQQLSACCIARNGQILAEMHDIAELTMRYLSDELIDAYLAQDKPYQSCGAYHFEGKAKWLFTQVIGSESTIQGLPIIPLIQALIELKIINLG